MRAKGWAEKGEISSMQFCSVR